MYKIFVGSLSHSATEDSIQALFAAYGRVESVRIIRDRDTGESRGFAFVEMTNEAEGRKAVSGLDRTDFDGRTLKISEARPKEDRGFPGERRERRFHRY